MSGQNLTITDSKAGYTVEIGNQNYDIEIAGSAGNISIREEGDYVEIRRVGGYAVINNAIPSERPIYLYANIANTATSRANLSRAQFLKANVLSRAAKTCPNFDYKNVSSLDEEGNLI